MLSGRVFKDPGRATVISFKRKRTPWNCWNNPGWKPLFYTIHMTKRGIAAAEISWKQIKKKIKNGTHPPTTQRVFRITMNNHPLLSRLCGAWALPVPLLSSVHRQLVSPVQSWVVCLSTLPPLQPHRCPQCTSEETTQPLLFYWNTGKRTASAQAHTQTDNMYVFMSQMSLMSEASACNISVVPQLRNKTCVYVRARMCVSKCVNKNKRKITNLNL